MTWTVEDTAYMLQAIAGPDPKDPTSSRAQSPISSTALKEDIKGLTIEWCRGISSGLTIHVQRDVNGGRRRPTDAG